VSWYALVHEPGPALESGESAFAHPAFAEHVAFLGRLQERGLLVAAGPFNASGSGMTIVHVLPEHGDVNVTALATTDDLSVVIGLLTVTVKPWDVRFAAPNL
jgi:uncharacterized protein YciI